MRNLHALISPFGAYGAGEADGQAGLVQRRHVRGAWGLLHLVLAPVVGLVVHRVLTTEAR